MAHGRTSGRATYSMTSETNISREALREISKRPTTRLFRNNTGTAWQGDVTRRKDGSILIENPRPVHFGLCVGGSDHIGWDSIIITPEMVGQRIAVFTALEAKKPKGRRTEKQVHFIDTVLAAGGKAGFYTSVREALSILCGTLKKK